MRVRSGLLLLSLLLAVGLAATILLTREPTPIAIASVPDPPAETSQAPPRIQTPTNPLCENGTAVSSPADNPGLVADCSVLLAVKDTLRGTATLNWSATPGDHDLGRHHGRAFALRRPAARDEAESR